MEGKLPKGVEMMLKAIGLDPAVASQGMEKALQSVQAVLNRLDKIDARLGAIENALAIRNNGALTVIDQERTGTNG